MADDVNSWRNVSPALRLRPFPCLSANVCVILHLIEGPNFCAEAVAALELQARCHEEQLRLMRRRFVEQLAVMREMVHNKIRVQFAEVGLDPEAPAAATEEEEEEEDEL